MKSSIFWDITARSPLKLSQHFGGTCRHRLQGRRVSQAINQLEGDSNPEDEGDMFHRSVRWLWTDWNGTIYEFCSEVLFSATGCLSEKCFMNEFRCNPLFVVYCRICWKKLILLRIVNPYMKHTTNVSLSTERESSLHWRDKICNSSSSV
jgi:hypothetical protein